MTGPHLRQPFTPAEQRVAEGIRSGLQYKDIGKPETVRKHVAAMSVKIVLPEDFNDFPPRWRVKIYVGSVEYEATKRERFFKSA